MPRAKISDEHGWSVELEATEASYIELGEKALELLSKAAAAVDARPSGARTGFAPKAD